MNQCSQTSKPQPLSLKQLAKQATASIYTPKMQFIDISIEGVDQLLQGLSPNKASGPDEISPKILKELHHEIAPILTLIFNLSLETGVVPIDWRTADVVPVYKKGSKSKASNYRPISLTCIQWRIVGSRGPGARNFVGALCKGVTQRIPAGFWGRCEHPRRGPGRSPRAKCILATIY